MPIPSLLEIARPRLRPVEVIVVRDDARGRLLMLRDPEGIAPSAVVLPLELSAVVTRFDGTRSSVEIAAEVSDATGRAIDAALVERVAEQLDRACMLDTPRFRAHRRHVMREFKRARVRPPAHAGGAYHGDPDQLADFIETDCLARAPARAPSSGRLVGLCAPHMDLWRASAGYGHAYAALAQFLRSREGSSIDVFVLLGTSHAVMRRPYAACDKTFATPLGSLEPERALLAELAQATRFDVHEDEFLHRGEHSLEFQVVFLRHLLGGRSARIVPILCGLSECQERRRDPARDADAASFVDALAAALERRRDRVMVVAGADLAHVGPRFGDPEPLDAQQREGLRTRDHQSIARALELDAAGFFAHVAEDLEERRVCGLGPIYTLLRALPRGARGRLFHYDQCIDPDEGSIVSHASLGFYA